MERQDEKLSGDRRAATNLRGLGPYLTMGIQLAIPVIAFFFLGRWLDHRWNTSPWLMIGGIALGGVGGMIKFISSAMKLGQQQDKLDAEQKQQKKV
jgi:F0F1-type ATP synthase assembly protein I